MNSKCELRHKSKHRSDEEKKQLKRRIKIINGQLNGISQMIDDDRYCDDVLLQVASVTNALKGLGNEILREHMNSCMVEEIQKGNTDVVDDIFKLFGKLK